MEYWLFKDEIFEFQAVLAAPCDEKTGKSKELSIALANRSAVLFSLKAYHLALDDIKVAFDAGYPEELQFKLLERKAKIMMFFKQFSTARDTYKELLKSLDIAKVDANKKAKLQKETQQALKFFEKAPSVYNDPNVVMKVKPELPKLPDKNKKLFKSLEFQIFDSFMEIAMSCSYPTPFQTHPIWL